MFDLLKESEKFHRAIIELAMEVALDNGWAVDYSRMYDEIVMERGARKYEEYAADVRSKIRDHG